MTLLSKNNPFMKEDSGSLTSQEKNSSVWILYLILTFQNFYLFHYVEWFKQC